MEILVYNVICAADRILTQEVGTACGCFGGVHGSV